jgi:hypothetical protein
MSNDVAQRLSALGQGDPHAASRLLPLAYDELRKLAAQRMAQGEARSGDRQCQRPALDDWGQEGPGVEVNTRPFATGRPRSFPMLDSGIDAC